MHLADFLASVGHLTTIWCMKVWIFPISMILEAHNQQMSAAMLCGSTTIAKWFELRWLWQYDWWLVNFFIVGYTSKVFLHTEKRYMFANSSWRSDMKLFWMGKLDRSPVTETPSALARQWVCWIPLGGMTRSTGWLNEQHTGYLNVEDVWCVGRLDHVFVFLFFFNE